MNVGDLDRTGVGDISRYGVVARSLHWILALGIGYQVWLGSSIDDFVRGTPERADAINLHKSIGLVILGLVVVRFAWRLWHAPPAWPAAVPAMVARFAELTHRLLYALMFLVPVTAVLSSNLSKHGLSFFGWPIAPLGPDLPAVHEALEEVHSVLAWVLVGVVAVHLAAFAWHAFIRRDGLAARMGVGRARATTSEDR